MENHSLPELLCTDLNLDSCQWEEKFPGAQKQSPCLEIDCLVQDGWLSAAQQGCCSPAHIPQFSHEEIHSFLQPSCDAVLPPSWQRVHISCFKKQEVESQSARDKYLVPQSNVYSQESIHEFLTQVAQENVLVSWRETLESVQPRITPLAQRQASNSYIRQLLQQLYGVQVKCISPGNKSSSANTEKLNITQGHANVIPLLAGLESRHAFYLISPFTRFSLFDAAMHSPDMFSDSIAKPLFVLFQLLKVLSDVHGQGITLGEVNLKTVFVDTRLWIQVRPQILSVIQPVSSMEKKSNTAEAPKNKQTKVKSQGYGGAASWSPSPTPTLAGFPPQPSLAASTLTLTDSVTDTPSINSTSWIKSYTLPILPLSEAVSKWRQGDLSNFDYLMLLNHHSGRIVGDPNNHPIFPWVMDFTHSDSGFRDLSRSKHYLTKGEDQLNFMFLSALEEIKQSPSEDPIIPHHIGDISTDVTYYVYLARKTPKQVLCTHVRPRWVPEEYPVSMEKMYIWSPDECIPEFYADASIFNSIHPDLCDLQVPQWSSSPGDFIRMHRNVLEGDIVSSNLHHWIDLMFGYKLTGHDAIKAKNVYLSVVDKHKHPTNSGIVQLFKSSHPKRVLNHSGPLALHEWASYLHRSSVMNVSSFSICQTANPDPVSPTPYVMNNKQSLDAGNSKTLETILFQESAKERALPQNESDSGPHPDLGQENQEEDFYGSFEHVNLPKESKNKSTAEAVSSNSDSGVHLKDLAQPERSKVKGDSVVMTGTSTRFRVPVVDRILNRQRRGTHHVEGEVDYEWHTTTEISLPKEARILERLTRLEELNNFVSKSCKDEGDLFANDDRPPSDKGLLTPGNYSASHVQRALTRVGEDPCYCPSLEERIGMDVVAVTCTVVELCCVRQLRAAIPASATLLQRVSTILKLLKLGQLKLPSYLLSLVDFVLSPETMYMSNVTHLPTFTSSLLLQPFLPVVTFPVYFEPLYRFLYDLEQLIRQSPLDKMTFNLQRLQLEAIPSLSSNFHGTEQFDKILTFISTNLDSVLKQVNNEGFPLLLLHLFPFFVYPDTSFDAIFTFLDPLAKWMGRRNVGRLFSLPVIHLFDTATEPHHRGQLLCRTTADLLMRRFGLRLFLTRFIGFILEAVLEPVRGTSTKSTTACRVNPNIMRMQSQSVLISITSNIAFEDIRGGRGRNTDLSFSLDLSDGHHGYDSDKDYSSDESDGESLAEVSILAKPGMFFTSLNSRDSRADSAPPPYEPSGSDSASPSSPNRLLSNQQSPRGTPDRKLNFDLPASPRSVTIDSSQEDSLEYSITSSLGIRHTESGMGVDSKPKPEDTDSHGGSPVGTFLDSFDVFREDRADSFGGQSSLRDKSPSIDQILSDDELDALDEEDSCRSGEAVPMSDPLTLAINSQIADIAADSLCWLSRRLGPLLATHHIIRPLLDGLYRCYIGVVDARDRQGPVLKILSSFAEFYGSDTILKLLIPRAENMVTAAMGRMSVKTEAGVAASLSLIRIAIKQLTQDLLESISKDLCDGYFVPLIQLLSSQTTFPSQGVGRAAICRSMVDLLLLLGERLGREEARKLLISILQCFFSCFSSVHSHEEETQLWKDPTEPKDNKNDTIPPSLDKSNSLKADDLFDLSVTPTEQSSLTRSISKSTPVNIHPLSSPVTQNGAPDSSQGSTPTHTPIDPLQSESYIQLCATFSQPMAYAAYIPFCRLLGQHYLNENLINTDLIEHIAYKQDAIGEPTDPLPVVLCEDSEIDSEVSSIFGSDSEDDVVGDAALKVGPISAVTGLGMDEPGFGRPSWFISLQEDKAKTGASQKDKTVTGVRDSLLNLFRSSSESTMERVQDFNVGFSEAAFDAKFSGITPQTTPLETPISATVVMGVGVPVGVAANVPLAVFEKEDYDYTLMGQWSHIWEKQLHKSLNVQDSFGQFKGVKLQTFTGHRSVIRSLSVSNNEQIFVSTSKDKLAKLWKLGNHGNGSSKVSCHLTYSGHSKTVSGAELMEETGHVVSCDGTVHVWDMETGFCIHQFQPSHGTVYSALEAISSSQPIIAVAINPDLCLRFLDLRAKTYMHKWKLQFPTGGTLRCLACADNWIAVGNYNGQINTLDIRTGELLSSWKPFDIYPSPTTTWNDSLLQFKSTQRGNLITSVGSGILSLWKPTHGHFLHPLKCPSHPYHCLEVVGDQMISVSSNGHFNIHDHFETKKEDNYFSTKIRNRGVSALSALKENRLMLLGSDNGIITLMT